MIDIENHLSLLVQLSKVDNFMAAPESKMIHYLGKLNGLSEDQVENIIDNPKPIGNLVDLNSDDKFDYLFNVVQLMKVDGKVFQSEIDFCEKTALLLGYKPAVIADLSAYIYSDPAMTSDRGLLKSIADKNLMPKK